MANLTQTERLVKLETLMETFYQEFKDFRDEMKSARAGFVTAKKHEEDIKEVKAELAELKGKRWVQNTLSAILGAVLSLLVAFFITNIGG